MRGLIVEAGRPDSAQLVDDLPEPDPAEGQVLVQGLAVGICGTDRDILAGEYGTAPGPDGRLVLGHESLGRVVSDDSGRWQPGDLVAGIVRRPDPVPCPNCAIGEWDMCRNGQYTECGIKQRHGFARERWRTEPDFAVGLDPALAEVGVLLEPASVVAKAWEHLELIGARAQFGPRTVLVTGAGPIGLLAALLGRQRGLEVHVLDRADSGPKPELVRRLGATYHTGAVRDLPLEPDLALECTGAPTVIADTLRQVGPNGIVCLTGVSTGGRALALDLGGLNREVVLENNVAFGSVNANMRHWQAAAADLLAADHDWLSSLITRRVPLDSWPDALQHRPTDIKVVLHLT
ncbi:threonine dehydrogenase [Catellatospora sp. TT07R-123]|uniref:glucose 1-dehydrogenase n=1 Tax=Catellatospora sp. TT07R-123 TaxID=2733863 RepID=UPI001B1DBAC4|nr:glucose 1-dehydrogenase [Catellatospora sp. TT07R-123]GHJ48653.1 threonine dehydrogenase [Catellatospora sp. TT07R-123]